MKKKDKAFREHCMRMNELVLMRNDKLKHLTDDQYFSMLARRADESYKKMGEQQ